MDQIKKREKMPFLFFTISMALLMISVCSCSNDYVNLGKWFRFDVQNEYITSRQIGFMYPVIIENQLERRDIPPRVIDYVYDKRYILVKQKPKLPLEQIYYDSDEFSYPMGTDSVYYWIVDKNKGAVLGPFLFDDYKSKCLELEICLHLSE